MFFLEKKPPAGLHHTENRIGDAPKPQFSIKSFENQQNPAISVETEISQLLRRLFPQFSQISDSEIVMVDGMFFGDSFEQDRPWDDSGTTISGI